jgi:hypothetical protein
MKSEEFIKFINGKFYVGRVPCLLCPIQTTAVFFDFLYKKHEDVFNEIHNILKNVFLEYSLNICLKKGNVKMKVDFFLKIINSLGLGEIKIPANFIGKNKFMFVSQNSTVPKVLNSLFGYFPKKSFFVQNILEGFLEALTGKELKKEFYIKQNSSYYIFHVTENEIQKRKINLKFNLLGYEKSKEELNAILKRVVVNKNLKNNNGVLTIWNMTVLALPLEIYSLEKISKNKEILNFFEIVGRTQGKAAFHVMANMFGVKERNKIFVNNFSQTDLVGVGKAKILNFDENKKEIEVQFLENIVLNKRKVTNLGTYFLGIFKEMLSNLFGEFFEYEIKEENKIKYFSNGKKYFVEKEVEELSKFMGIKTITKGSSGR